MGSIELRSKEETDLRVTKVNRNLFFRDTRVNNVI